MGFDECCGKRSIRFYDSWLKGYLMKIWRIRERFIEEIILKLIERGWVRLGII